MTSIENAPWEDDQSLVPNDSAVPEIKVPFHSTSPTDESSDEESETLPPEKAPLVNEIAMEFIGFWNRLVSQTNWEKGKVIHTWRTRLIEAGIPRSLYSDESIARRIGNVSSQHIGRLRRVYERFGDPEAYRENDRFTNLYWSHYQAALDWEDADDWLDKASADGLSVAQMRIARWEKYGAPADRKPKESEIVASEPDEDVNPMNDSNAEMGEIDILPPGDGNDERKTRDRESSSKEGETKSDLQEENQVPTPSRGSDEPWESTPKRSTVEILREMTDYPALPDDLAGPIDNLKTGILNHRLAGWEEVAQTDLLKWLDALRGIVLAEE